MNNTRQDWKRLPTELLQRILEIASVQQSKVESCNLALVCKTWFSIVQTVSYSNVIISTISQLKKFYNVINHNSHLGLKIKNLDLQIDSYEISETERIEASILLTSLLATSVPNLEILTKKDSHIPLPPLSNFLNIQLKHLRKLQQPNGFRECNEADDYVNNALLLKNRLENVYIICNSKKISDQYQRLYNSLHQFKNLVEITLEIETTNGVQVLEYLTKSGRSLKKIDINLALVPSNAVSVIDISNYVPASNIKALSVTIHGLKDENSLLLYIMRKFQQLQYLDICLHEDEYQFNIYLINQLLEYVSTINQYSVEGLLVSHSNLMEAIGRIWDKTSEPGTKKLYFSYADSHPENVKTPLRFTNIKKLKGRKNWIALKYPTNVDFPWGLYMDFIETSGKYISDLRFVIMLDDNSFGRSELPQSFFPHTLTYCTNLRNLLIDGCILKLYTYSKVQFNNRFCISELHLRFCDIEPGIFEQLSVLLQKINQLLLHQNTPCISGNQYDDDYYEIIMPDTNISSIAFQADEVLYVKVCDMTDKNYYYYHIDSSLDEQITSTTAKEFEAKNDKQHIYISCPKKPEIGITLEGYM